MYNLITLSITKNTVNVISEIMPLLMCFFDLKIKKKKTGQNEGEIVNRLSHRSQPQKPLILLIVRTTICTACELWFYSFCCFLLNFPLGYICNKVDIRNKQRMCEQCLHCRCVRIRPCHIPEQSVHAETCDRAVLILPYCSPILFRINFQARIKRKIRQREFACVPHQLGSHSRHSC